MSIINVEKLIYKKPRIQFQPVGEDGDDDDDTIIPGDDSPIDVPGSGETTGE